MVLPCVTSALLALPQDRSLTESAILHALHLTTSELGQAAPQAPRLFQTKEGRPFALEWEPAPTDNPALVPPVLFAKLGLPLLSQNLQTGQGFTYSLKSPIKGYPVDWSVSLLPAGNSRVRLVGLHVPPIKEPVLCLLSWPGTAERVFSHLHSSTGTWQASFRQTEEPAFRAVRPGTHDLCVMVEAVTGQGESSIHWVDPSTGSVLASFPTARQTRTFAWSGAWGLSTATARTTVTPLPAPKSFTAKRTTVLSNGTTWVIAEHDPAQRLVRTKTETGYLYATAPALPD